jgi:hypothetical protein
MVGTSLKRHCRVAPTIDDGNRFRCGGGRCRNWWNESGTRPVAPFPHSASVVVACGPVMLFIVAATYGHSGNDDDVNVFASEWVSFPTNATANYRPGRLPSTLKLVIVAYSSSVQCRTML